MQATLLPPRSQAHCTPITSNRSLGDCLIANIPIRKMFAAELSRAGMQLVEPEDACERTLRIPIDNWIELGALLMLARNEGSTCLLDEDGALLAWKGKEDPGECEDRITTNADCFAIRYPWDFLRMNEEILNMMDESSLKGDISATAHIEGVVRIAEGTRILPGSVIEGPVVIGANCTIGPNAYIRGATSIAANCHIGNGAEIKNSIIYDKTSISRHCYIGDSIVGHNVTLGASTCTENHRHDGRLHTSMIDGRDVDTGRYKMGAIIGDGVRTGVNTSLLAGIKIGVARTTRPGAVVEKDMM